jgi:acetolactate synthase-1/3 small subunit
LPSLPIIYLKSGIDRAACFSFDGGAMRHTITVLVENRFGVLTRIAGLFSGRGFNIETLNVGPTHRPDTSRMTLVVVGSDRVLDQVTRQLNKLVDVIEVKDFHEGEYVDRELVLLKIKIDAKVRAEVMQICDIFRAKIVDVFITLMESFGILDLTRTGKVAIARK